MFLSPQTPVVEKTPEAMHYNPTPQIADGETNQINRLLFALRNNMVGHFDKTHALSCTVTTLDILDGVNDEDGSDSTPPNSASIANARKWIETFYNETISRRFPWLEPHVSINEDGDVTFEWWNDKKKLTVYVTPHDSRYIQVWGADVMTEMSDGIADSPEERQDAWTWLVDNSTINVDGK